MTRPYRTVCTCFEIGCPNCFPVKPKVNYEVVVQPTPSQAAKSKARESGPIERRGRKPVMVCIDGEWINRTDYIEYRYTECGRSVAQIREELRAVGERITYHTVYSLLRKRLGRGLKGP